MHTGMPPPLLYAAEILRSPAPKQALIRMKTDPYHESPGLTANYKTNLNIACPDSCH